MFRLALFMLSFIVFMHAAHAQPKDKSEKKLPNFAFVDLDGIAHSTHASGNAKYTMVVYFDPDCDHCNEQAERIKKEMNKFKNVKMIWTSFGDENSMKNFKQKYFGNNKNVVFFHDPKMNIFKYFPDAIETPTLYLFENKTKTQLAKLGECEASKIYAYFK